MEKIEIDVATGNLKSRKVPERLGFDLEGISTRAEEMNGKILDHAKYGLLKNKKPAASA
jgi:ribosomal-protein-serine acetyltransferase